MAKTTTSQHVAWILDMLLILHPGVFNCGIPGKNFAHVSARLGASPFFVIEADEYGLVLFLINVRNFSLTIPTHRSCLNNLGVLIMPIFFDSLADIKKTSYHLLRNRT